MSWLSEYIKLRKKREEEEKANTSTAKPELPARKKAALKASANKQQTFAEEYNTLRSQRQEEDIAPVRTSSVNSTRNRKEEKEEQQERRWFNSGLFADGYQFGDITKTILGTVTDVGENLGSGVLGMGEKIVDAAAYLAPMAENAQFYQNGGIYTLEQQKAHEKAVEQSKTELQKFIQKDLYDEQKIARTIITNPMERVTGINAEDTSVFGEKSDSLIQSGGQLLGTMGLQAVGVPWFVTTGATSFGGETENAMNQGANWEEAGMSATVSAGAEILSEKLSGGISFGGKTLDDAATKWLGRSISSKLGRTMAKLGMDMAGEGAEEVFSQVASNLGSALYKEDSIEELLLSEEAIDEYIESFIGGAALGGVSSGFKAATSKTDYVTELTENEQKVVDKVYKDRLAEKGKVTEKEKAKIYDQVLRDLEKGYISTDTIEEVLGGEAYKGYKQTVDFEDKILKEYDELGKKQNATLAEQKRYNELDSKVRDMKEFAWRKSAKSKLSKEVTSLVQGDRLIESYVEKGRRGQKFEADLSRYDEKQQSVIQRAVDSGILNNTNRTHEFVDMVAKISADKGVLFDFTNNSKLKESGFAVDGKMVNGYVTKDGVTVNIDSAKSMNSIVGHEITHVLEGTEFYDTLQKTVLEYAKAKGDYQGRYDSLSKLYENIRDANVDNELTADLVGDYLFTDTDFIQKLSTEHRNVFQKIYDEIKYLCKVATAGSKEARELEKVKKAFEDAYRAEGKNTEAKAEEFYDSTTKYSLRVTDKETLDFLDNQETVTTYKTMQLVDGKLYPPMASRIEGKFEDYSELGAWEQATEHPELIKNGNKFKLDKGKGQGSIEAAYNPYMHSSNLVLNDQFSGAYKRDNLVTVECEVPVSELSSGYHAEFAKDSVGWHPWHTGTVAGQLRKAKGTERQVLLSRWIKPVRIVPDSEVAAMYKEILDGTDVEVPDNVVTPALLNELKKAGVKIKESGRVKYSISDSDGKELTKEQQEYFKDSKMRDENGNLKVMYHGSQDAGFHVFDPNMSDDGTSFFFVDRNDVAASYSGTSETYEAKTIRSAADMNSFLAEIGYDQYKAVEKNGKFELLENGDHVAWSDTAQGIYEEFCWYEGVGDGDANYKVYLNLKNPLEVDAEGKNWNNLSREFSQEVYDRYKSLTDSEKTALAEIADWGEYSIFRTEILEMARAKGNGKYHDTDLASAYEKLGGANANLYDAFSIASDNFSEESLRQFAVKQMNTRDYAQKAQSEGYDGVIFKNIVDNGGYSNGSEGASTVAIAFESNQIKSVANEKPTGDKDIRFSLSEAVEETKDLIAVHNLHAAELVETLKLSGLPSPSIAIIKAKDGHDKYGDVSLILPKDAIDPQKNKKNRIYGSDAWTPTRANAQVEYEVNYDIQRQFERAVEQLGKNVADGIFSRSSVLGSAGIEDSTGMNLEEIAHKISGYDAVRAAYVAENGGNVETVYREKKFDSYGNNALASYINSVGEQEVARLAVKMLTGERLTADEIEVAKDSMMESWIASKEYVLKQKPALRETRIAKFRDNISDLRVEDFVRHAWEFYEDNGAKSDEVDYGATGQNLRNAAERSDVEKWVTEKLQGLLGEPAIYNGKDPFGPGGKRRTFKEMHWEYTAENIVRAMNNADARGANVWNISGEAIIATATPEYKNIDEVRADKDRLFNAEKGDYEQIKDEISGELQQVTKDIIRKTEHHSDNQYDEEQIIGSVIMEAAQGTKTLSGVKQVFRKNGYAIGDAQAKSVLALFDHASKVPTGYFEAKPQRVVGFDEVGVYVIPYDADTKLKQELLNRGYAIAEYDPKVEGDRQRVVNQFEEYKFSLSNVGDTPKQFGSYNVSGKDIAFEAPVAENATIHKKTQLTAENSTVNATNATVNATPVLTNAENATVPVGSEMTPTVSETESVAPVAEEMFPDDLAPAPAELERLLDEEADIRGAMEAYAAVGDEESVNKLIPEHEALKERIRELQQSEAERADSLTDADAPPEEDARFPGESNEEYVENPFEDRDWYDMKNRKVKAYMYENPEVKPFFQEEAMNLLGEMNDGNQAETWYNDQLHYESGGEKGFGGIKRHMPKDIEEMLDSWHMRYDDIRKGLNAIIEDNGAENIAAAKKIEFMLNRRLLHGYESFYTKKRVLPNDAYIDLLYEKQINEYSEEAFAKFMETADQYAPVAATSENFTTTEEYTAVENVAPVATETVKTDNVKGVIKGQQTMFSEPKHEAIKPKPKAEPRMARATPAEQARAEILVEEPEVQNKKPGAWEWVKNSILDKGMVFEDLSLATGNRELQARWNSIRYAEGKAQKLIGEGNASVRPLSDIEQEVKSSGKLKTFYEYLYHMHNIDRMTLEQRFHDVPNKAVFGDSVTADISRAEVSKLERQNPEFKNWARDVWDYNKYLREMAVDGGLISREIADLWQTMYPHYVPIRRAGDTGLNVNVPLDTGRTGVNAPFKKAKGGSRDILPLFDTMGQRTLQTYRAISKNRFGVELKNTLRTTISRDASNVDEAIDSMDADLLQQGKNGQKPTFTVFENGEKVTFEITDEMYNAMKPTSDMMHYTNKVANAVSNFRRGTLTEYNPWFLLKNAVKDTQDVLINSQHPGRTYAAMPKAIKHMLSNGHYYQEYMENGGEQNSYFDGQTNTFKEENKTLATAKKIFGLDAISKANNVIERLPRLAEYIASREAGESVDVAMLDAARVTTNFAAGGDVTKFFNRNGFTFLNASVQGAVQQARNIREAKMNGLKGWTSLAAKYIVAGIPAVMLNHLIWDDDEEYAELSDYVKQSYYIVGKFGDGKFVRIPKGRTVAVIQNAFEQMENLITGNDEADLKTFLELAVSNLAPNNPLENNILSPIFQVANNETWYGEDLVPTRLQDLPASEQYDETTDSISRWLGETFNVSPYKANYLIDQYSGVIGDTFLPMLTPEAESGNNDLLAPLRDMFTTDSVLKNQNVSDFYDLKDELAVIANGSNATDEDKLKAKYINSVSASLSELYQKKREIQNSGMSDEEKYAEVRDIQQQIVDLMKEGMSSYQDISYEDDYRAGGEYARVADRVYKLTEGGEWQKLSDEQLTKYEVTKAAGDASYASDGTNHYRWYVKDGESQGEWVKITDKQLEKQQEVTKALRVSPSDYWENKEEYDFAYDSPESYAVAKAVGGYEAYKKYSSELYDIKADKDEWGKSISGSRKEKVLAYINGLDADYWEKVILFKSEYTSYDDENYGIIDYLNSRDDISYKEMEYILLKLGFEVDSKGNIRW